MECEGEVGRGENGKGLDEDVGDGLVFGEMGIELVPLYWHTVSKQLHTICFECNIF